MRFNSRAVWHVSDLRELQPDPHLCWHTPFKTSNCFPANLSALDALLPLFYVEVLRFPPDLILQASVYAIVLV